MGGTGNAPISGAGCADWVVDKNVQKEVIVMNSVMLGLVVLQIVCVLFQFWLIWVSQGKNPIVWGGLFVTLTMLIVTIQILF